MVPARVRRHRGTRVVCSRDLCADVISVQGLLSVCERMDLRGVDSSALRSLSPSLFLRAAGSFMVVSRCEERLNASA